MWRWCVKMPTQYLLRLLLLVPRNVLTKVWCRFGGWSLVIKLIFCSGFEHKVRSGFWSWSSGEILKLKFGQYFAAEVWLRSYFVLQAELNHQVRCAFGKVYQMILLPKDSVKKWWLSKIAFLLSLSYRIIFISISSLKSLGISQTLVTSQRPRPRFWSYFEKQ